MNSTTKNVEAVARKQKLHSLRMQERDWYTVELAYQHPQITPQQLNALIKQRFPKTPYPKSPDKFWDISQDKLKRRRQAMYAAGLIGRNDADESVYTFFPVTKGVKALEKKWGEELYWTRTNFRRYNKSVLRHPVYLNEFAACLTLSLHDTGYGIKDWRQDSRIFEKIVVPPYDDLGYDDTQLEPDARFVLAHPDNTVNVCYPEADYSGSVHQSSASQQWHPKTMLARFRRYWYLFKQTQRPMIVLTFTHSARRMKNLQKLIRENEPWGKVITDADGKPVRDKQGNKQVKVLQKTSLFWLAHATWQVDWDLDQGLHLPVLDTWETAWEEPKSFLKK